MQITEPWKYDEVTNFPKLKLHKKRHNANGPGWFILVTDITNNKKLIPQENLNTIDTFSISTLNAANSNSAIRLSAKIGELFLRILEVFCEDII